jgi:hypothetical protein
VSQVAHVTLFQGGKRAHLKQASRTHFARVHTQVTQPFVLELGEIQPALENVEHTFSDCVWLHRVIHHDVILYSERAPTWSPSPTLLSRNAQSGAILRARVARTCRAHTIPPVGEYSSFLLASAQKALARAKQLWLHICDALNVHSMYISILLQ